MFILQPNKYTIHELNQKNFENTQTNFGMSSTLGSRLRREMEIARQGVGRAREAGHGSSTSGRLRRGCNTQKCIKELYGDTLISCAIFAS
jgi:hypothetical protein